MTKQSISSNYREHCFEQYLRKCKYPTTHNVIIIGYNSNNIGGEINNVLTKLGHIVDTLSEDEFDVNYHNENINWDLYDTFIFNSGVTYLNWLENQPDKNIEIVIDTILIGAIKTTKYIINCTLNTKVIKTIIYIGSMAHNHVLNASAPYCAAKAGLQMFAKCMAYELAPKGYRVYCVNPSNVQDSPMAEKTIDELMKYRGINRDQATEYWGADCPMEKFLSKVEIGEIIAFLLTDSARYLSGSEINLPGGNR